MLSLFEYLGMIVLVYLFVYLFFLILFHTEFKAALRSQGPLCILEHFDTGYSVLQ